MIKDMRSKKVFLILDKLRGFRVKLIKVWLAQHVGQIGMLLAVVQFGAKPPTRGLTPA